MLDRRSLLAGGIAVAALTATRPARAAPTPAPLPEVFTPAAMAMDLRAMRESYRLLHPGLTRYLTPGAFDDRVDAALRWAERDRTPGEFYLALARLTAAVRCGHTHANPANQRGVVQRELLGRADRLPFCTDWIGGRMIVTDPLDSGLLPGTIVERVDGIDAGTLLGRMLPLTRADGSNDAKRIAQLGLHRGDRFAAFDVLRPLLYPATRPGQVDLRLRAPNGRRRDVSLPTLAEGKRGVPTREDAQFGWRFALDSDGIGLLTMPDWSLYDSKWDWRAFLQATVDTLIDSGARGLILDLRENEGGIDCGDVLLTRLIDRPIAAAPRRRLVRFRETPAGLRPMLDTWDPTFHQLGANARRAPDRPGFLELPPEDDAEIHPQGRRFAGPVAVLIGPVCSSATFHFADLVHTHRLGRLIGQPSGGNRRGINGGCYFFVRLPETRMEVDLPLIGYFPTTPQPDAGVVPDIIVAPTRAAIARGHDEAMTAAKRAITA